MKKNDAFPASEKKRLILVAITSFVLFSLLVAQYFKIQIVDGDKWTKIALLQHEMIVSEPFKRGTFYSNTSLKKGHPEVEQPFVVDVTKFHLYIDPESIPEEYRKDASSKLQQLIGVPENQQAEFFREFTRRSRSRKLAMWLDRDMRDQIQAWWSPFAKSRHIPRNALYFITDYQRSYPFNKLLGQVLHTIRTQKEERTQQGLPTGGLEAYFNDYLKGKQGKRKLMRSPLNSLETGSVIEAPENGADIYLTINHYLQAVAEEELAKGVKVSRAKSGWVMMMDPQSGEILASAQYPFFEPANYQDYFNDPEKIADAKTKAITDGIELGSIMKPITLAVCLKANEDLKRAGKKELFNPLDKIDTTQTIFPGRASKPLRDTSFHHYLNMYMALQKSSNIYMAKMVDRVVNQLGNDWYRKTLSDTFGFGLKTGIELPGESPGLLPTPGKKHPNGALEWSTPTPYSLAIGFNILASSLQMMRAYAVFANGGILVQPTLVRKIVKHDSNGEAIVLVDNTQKERIAAFPRVMDKESVTEVVKALKYVTKPGGTARLADIYGYTEAGKTGTAEKIVNGTYCKQRYVSSFVGFAPANIEEIGSGKIVMIVSIEEPEVVYIPGVGKNHHGGHAAAPIFREIAKKTLEYLGVTPDDPYGYPAGDPRADPIKADWQKELIQLKQVYDLWNHNET